MKKLVILWVLIFYGVWTGEAGGPEVDIFPDYKGVTLPNNIAPINFYIKSKAGGYRVKIHSSVGPEIQLGGPKAEVIIPESKWKEMLSANAGEPLYIDISLKNESGQWQDAVTITNRIAAEPIDGWLAYRLMRSIFNTYQDMGIYQRNLESYQEREILHNSRIAGGCLNCHGFQKNDPREMTFHIRQAELRHPLVWVREGEKVEVLEKTFTYYGWNPKENLLAFTANAPSIFFHAWGENREVYDRAGEVGLFNLDKRTTIEQSNLASEHHYESWPSWDWQGEYLYYCKASDLPLDKFKEIRFDLMRAHWDSNTSLFSEPEILFSGWTNRMSSAQPKVSPKGDFLVYTVFERGNFPIYQQSADLYLMDLKSMNSHRLECNSDWADTWHSWSSNGSWLIFSSKRMDGLLARPHITHIDERGHASKAFVMPQKDPHFYEYFIKTYNIPELITGAVDISPKKLGQAVMNRANRVKTDSTDEVSPKEKEMPPEEGYSTWKAKE